MVIEKDKAKNYCVGEVRCFYFDERSLQVRDVKDLKITTGPLRLILYIHLRKQVFGGLLIVRYSRVNSRDTKTQSIEQMYSTV